MAFDVITPTKLGQAAITVGVTTLYTVPAATRTLLKELSIANSRNG
jgi:siroheme synthase (precorrin-2 oxidase/ferrochelatase)